MITIPAALARSCLGVFRRLPAQRGGDAPPRFGVAAGPGGVRLRFHGAGAAAEFHDPAPRPAADFCLPAASLEAAGSPVLLDPSKGGPADEVPRFPAWPAGGHADNGPELIAALAEAARTAARQPCRFALSGTLLRGKAGEAVATDGKQLLIQGGFRFGWQEDLLVPAVKVFESKELRGRPAAVARGKDHVFVRTGGWTVALKHQTGARYPDVNAVVPAAADVRTTCRLAPADVEAILEALPRLPGLKEKGSPVILELGGACRLVAGEAEDAGEVPLVASSAEGKAVKVLMDRRYLARAIRMGFDTLHVVAADKPILCRDAKRVYLWMPLDAGGPASPEPPAPRKSKEEDAMPAPPLNGRPPDESIRATPFDPLAEAEAVRDLLAEGQSRMGRLVGALKQHRRHARAVHSALASLRQLPPFAQ
jgi:hypothetical protein